jgi:hypothetical protein
VEVGDERLGDLHRAVLRRVLVDDRSGVFDHDRRRRHDVVHLLAGLPGDEDLVFVGQRSVADAVFERRHRLARALVHDLHVREDLGQQVFGRRGVVRRHAGLAAQRRAVDRGHVPHRTAARADVRL